MKNTFRIALALLGSAALAPAALAADVRVQPVTVEPLPGARTGSLTLINEEDRPVQVQIRVLRWTQTNGQDRLTETEDVVVSPPFVTLAPGQHNLVRVVHTARRDIRPEEHYRVLVDEVPDPADVRPGAVNLIVRQSIPVFFSAEPRRTSVVDWSVDHASDQLWLVAENRGNRRLRLSDISVVDHDDVIYHQPGLVGYVLPGATMRWPIEGEEGSTADHSLHLRGVSDTGTLEVPLVDAPGS